MRIDWSSLVTIFLAVVLAKIFMQAISGVPSGSSTQVSAVTHSPAEAVVIYANPIEAYIATNYPNTRR